MSSFTTPLFPRNRMPAASTSASPENTQSLIPLPTEVAPPDEEEEEEEDNQDNNQDPVPPQQQDPPTLQPPPPQDPPTEESTYSDTQQPPEDVRTLMRILGKAIQEVIEDHDINLDQAQKNQLEVFGALKDADEPISTFYQQLVNEEAKKMGRLAAITPGYWRLWQRDKQISQIPIKEAISNYCKLPVKRRQEYPNTEAFFPLCLDAYARQGSSGLKADFRRLAQFTNQKWRTPGMLIPKVYPTEFNFKKALVLPIVNNIQSELESIIFPIVTNAVYGINEEGALTCVYFFILEAVKRIQEYLSKKREVIPKPLFPLPQTGISSRMEREGMTQYEAAQATALFKIEYEACLLEIWSYTNPRLSAHTFRTKPYSIYQLIMPFWREEEQPNSNNTKGETSILKDLPPHIKGKGRVSFQPVDTTITPENQDAWAYRSQTAQQNVGS